MNNDTNNSPSTQPTRAPVAIGARGIQLTNYDELVRFSTAVSRSGLAPKGIQTPEAIFVAVQMGLEVGLSPMAALQNIAVINGRPSIWGDAQLGIVRATGELEEFSEWYEESGKRLPRNPAAFGDSVVAVCRVKRRGYDAVEVGFGVMDAKTAGLWGKEGPWRQYPARMIRNRARSFALRDSFGDSLKGLRSTEEIQDSPEINVTPDVERFAGQVAAQSTLTIPAALSGDAPKRRGRPPKVVQPPFGQVAIDVPTDHSAEPEVELGKYDAKKLEEEVSKLGANLADLHEAAVSDNFISPVRERLSSFADLPVDAGTYYLSGTNLADSINFIRSTR